MHLATWVNFRCSVAVGAAESPREGRVDAARLLGLGDRIQAVLVSLREAKVRELRVTVLVQDHILELQVSEDDAAGVQVLEAEGDLGGDTDRPVERQAGAALRQEQLLEVAARAVLHDEGPLTRVLDGEHKLDDKGVVPGQAQHRNLPDCLVGHPALEVELLGQPLHRVDLLRRAQPHLEDLPELAAADQPDRVEVLHPKLSFGTTTNAQS
mmetsp:Transcript_27590/g.79548  ORF Transcript_27590/g.79548 Transcript_27590/m.79548 type:complete len:211 (+) Transcript_27590:829-1461(+)